MKDSELVRIVDNKRLTNKAKEIISDHNNFMRSDRLSRPERSRRSLATSTITSRGSQEQASVKIASHHQKNQRSVIDSSQHQEDENYNAADVKVVNVKTANKTIRTMR